MIVMEGFTVSTVIDDTCLNNPRKLVSELEQFLSKIFESVEDPYVLQIEEKRDGEELADWALTATNQNFDRLSEIFPPDGDPNLFKVEASQRFEVWHPTCPYRTTIRLILRSFCPDKIASGDMTARARAELLLWTALFPVHKHTVHYPAPFTNRNYLDNFRFEWPDDTCG